MKKKEGIRVEKMGEPFRLGVIGCGIFAEANIFPSLSTHFFDDVQRVAVCDLRLKRAERLASKYGWKNIYTDFQEMIGQENLNGCVICLGSKIHPLVVPQVLRMGVPVFLEKAIAIDLEGTYQIAEAAKESGCIVQVDHQKRHSSAYKLAKKHVENVENFGNIIQIETKQHGFPVFPTFFTCMLEWQSHNLDLIQYFGGSIQKIESWSHRINERHGALTIMVGFKSGAIGIVGWGTFGGPGQFSERMEILGDQGKSVIVNNAREVTLCNIETGETWAPDWNPISPNQSHVLNGYIGGLRHFIDCVKYGEKPNPSIEDEVETMEWMFTIAKKAGIPTDWEFISSAL
ncbi:MAG TPA: hypothetical protein DF698_08440 [Candidatus Atribacteria bacterium]|nr:hypothetical protein [Candidatus Atribacteria bacterium]